MNCALCNEDHPLINSHLMPSAAYAKIRGGDQGNQSPIKIDLSSRVAFSTDKQIQSPLLCKRCEDLFSKKGEKKVGKLWYAKKRFPLFELLESKYLVRGGERFALYDSAAVDEDIRSSLFYFAISIFWRAQVWGSTAGGVRPSQTLPDAQLESFRKYLLDGDELKDVYLVLDLNSNPKMRAMMTLPSYLKGEGVEFYQFVLLGMKFSMYLGSGLTEVTKRPFLKSGTNIVFLSSDITRTEFFRGLVKTVRETVVPKGSLAKRKK